MNKYAVSKLYEHHAVKHVLWIFTTREQEAETVTATAVTEAAAQTYKEESKAEPCAYSRLEFCLHLLHGRERYH